MNNNLTLTIGYEYRPCRVGERNGTFHFWTTDGNGIVEFEDGQCGVVPAYQIKFMIPIAEASV
jgi:hypothetical protein